MKTFISHANEDGATAKKLEDLIAYENYQSWRFQRDMMGANPADPQLPANIESCELFLFTISEYSNDSEMCQKELQHAAINQKPIVPVRLQRETMVQAPLNDHQWVEFDCTQESAVLLMRALRNAQPLRRELIPDHWKTWDGKTKLEVERLKNADPGIASQRISRDLTVGEKRDFLQDTVAKSHAYFEHELMELARSDSRIKSRSGLNSSSSFSSFISIDGQLIKGCRIYISADSNGITYDGNTHNAVQWEVDEIRSKMKDINKQIDGNLQAVIDGDARVAAFVRSLDHQHAGLRDQLQDRETMLNEVGHLSSFQAGENSYRIQATVGKLDGEPVLEFLPTPNMTIEMPDSRICTIAEAAEKLSRVFIGEMTQ